jgi:hypothetical protein
MSLRMRLDPFDWPAAIRGDGRRIWRHWPSRSIAVRALPTACVLAILLTAFATHPDRTLAAAGPGAGSSCSSRSGCRLWGRPRAHIRRAASPGGFAVQADAP